MIPARLQDFQRLELPVSETVSGRIGYPHEAFMCFDYRVAPTLPAGDVVVLVSKGGRSAALQAVADHPGRVVLVAVPGDAPFRPAYLPDGARLPANVVAAYATSNLVDDERVTAVPLGVRVSNVAQARFVRQSASGAQRELLLGNFTLNDEHYRPDRRGRPHIRARLVEQLQGAPWARLDISSEPRTGVTSILDFYGQLARHRFVLSPEGNGIDCYRHWEALALGAVPIVMRSRAMEPFASLPLLVTDDYSELTETYLEERWAELSQRAFDIEPLLMSTYRRHFLRAVAELANPSFVCLEPGGLWSPRFLRALRRSPRSGAPTEVEVPVPPFLRADSLTEPASWRPFGDVSASAGEGGLTVAAAGGAAGGLRQRFPVVEGVRFALRGTAVASGAPVRVSVREAPAGPELASAAVTVGELADFATEFEAPAGRLWLQFELETAAGERTLTVQALEISALV